MTKTATALLCAAALLTAVIPAEASDQKRFQALVRKFVPELTNLSRSFAPKTLCICEPGVLNSPGVMLVDFGFAACAIPTFGSDGSLQSFTSCGHYLVVGK